MNLVKITIESGVYLVGRGAFVGPQVTKGAAKSRCFREKTSGSQIKGKGPFQATSPKRSFVIDEAIEEGGGCR